MVAKRSAALLEIEDKNLTHRAGATTGARLYSSRGTLRAARVCATCALFFILAGCCETAITTGSPRTGPPRALRQGEIIETATGRVIGMNRLIRKLSKVQTVYIGEIHTSVQDHEVQLEILKRLSRDGGCVELAMEMFAANAQQILDRYIDGPMSEADFLREVKWDEVWGYPYSLYKGLIDWQKQRRMPVVGLNAPDSIVGKIARHGLKSLTPMERSQVAREFHLNDPGDRQRVEEAFRSHGKYEIRDFESFFEAQLAWEETMAQTLARRQGQTQCQIVVLLGRGHMNKRFGVPHLTLLRRPRTTFATVAPVPVDYPADKLGPNLADYVVVTGPAAPYHPPRLGVLVERAPSGRGVEISELLPGSPAVAARLHKGDIIVGVNGKPVGNVDELRRALAAGGPRGNLLIERNALRLRVEVNMKP